MRSAQELFAFLTNKILLEDHWMQGPCLMSMGDLFLNNPRIINVESLIFDASYAIPEHIRFFHGGAQYRIAQVFPKRKFPNRPATIGTISKKKTMVIYQLFRIDSFFRELRDLVHEYLWARCQVAAFVSLHGRQGFKKHRDRQHIFSLQYIGKCRWKVYDPTGRKLILDVTLRPGDAIYVPVGFYHKVKRVTAVGCHISIGISYNNLRQEIHTLYTNPLLQQALIPEERGLSGNILRDTINAAINTNKA